MSRLLDSFASKQLIRPAAETLNTVDLVRGLTRLAGAAAPNGVGSDRIAGMVGQANHYVLVIIDGLGMNVIRKMPTSSFMVSHLAATMHAICPSTTACAMTTLSTGQWPATHAVTGWWTYLAERHQMCTLLPFVDRFTGKPLDCTPADILPCKSLYPTMKYSPLTLQHANITDTPYSRFWRGETPAFGYGPFSDAIDKAIEHTIAHEKTFTYVYFHDIDSISHKVGWDHENVMKVALMVDEQLARLAEGATEGTKIAVSSDHGQINVPVEARLAFYDDDPLMAYQTTIPSGNPRMPLFHIKPGMHEEFAHVFRERYVKDFVLLSIDEAEEMRLFGPEKLTPLARARFGDFVAIPFGPHTLNHYAKGKHPASDYYGQHAGLSPAEMEVPLVIA